MYFEEIDILTKKECLEIIKFAEKSEQLNESMEIGDGSYARYDFKDNKLAKKISDRLKIKHDLISYKFYISKYIIGDSIEKHIDGNFQLNDYKSKYTIVIYLNDDYIGGNTTIFLKDFKLISIKPLTGKALILQQNIEHQGDIIKKGIKYILRSDLMYKI